MKSLFSLLIVLGTMNCFAQKNLIINGGFNENLDNWWADNFTLSDVIKKTGTGSCMIVQYTGKDWKGGDQTITIPKGTYAITFSAWIKGDAIEGGESYGTGIFNAEFLNGGKKTILSESIGQVKGTVGWQSYQKTVIVPEGAKNVKILLALQSTPGTIFYDDVKAITVTEDNYLKLMQSDASIKKTAAESLENLPVVLTNGNFEEGVKNWNGAGTASTTDQKEGKSAVAITSITNEWTGIDQVADIPIGTQAIEVSGWLKAQNIKQGKDAWNQGVFITELTQDGKVKTTDDQTIGMVIGTTDWTYFQKSIPVPYGTAKYRIMLALSACTGTLLADDIQIKMISK